MTAQDTNECESLSILSRSEKAAAVQDFRGSGSLFFFFAARYYPGELSGDF